MPSLARRSLAVLLALALWTSLSTPVGTQGDSQPTNREVYEKFREWEGKQPPGLSSDELMNRYRALLKQENVSAPEIERQIRIIDQQAVQLEIERWNVILTAPSPQFNTRPNQFLVDMIKGVSPGKALDVGMGQGRNAIYLAQQHWDVTGFDPADKAVAVAEQDAKRLGVHITTVVQRDDQFDFGTNRWDLVVLSYVSARQLVPAIFQSLKPGGLVVLEAFHRDATKTRSIGSGVVYDTNELLRLFEKFRIVRYEDTEGEADFGSMAKLRLVRLCAQKP